MLNPDLIQALLMFLIGSLATYIAMGSYYNHIHKRSDSLEAQNKLIREEILDLADEIDQKARIQAVNLIFTMQKIIFNELMKDIPDDKINEVEKNIFEKEEDNNDS